MSLSLYPGYNARTNSNRFMTASGVNLSVFISVSKYCVSENGRFFGHSSEDWPESGLCRGRLSSLPGMDWTQIKLCAKLFVDFCPENCEVFDRYSTPLSLGLKLVYRVSCMDVPICSEKDPAVIINGGPEYGFFYIRYQAGDQI